MNSVYLRLPMFLFAVMMVYGLYMIFIQDYVELRMEKYKKALSNDEIANAMLRRTGLNIDAKKYYGVLYAAAIIVFALFVFRAIKYWDVTFLLMGLLAAGLIFICFRPVEHLIGDIASPFATLTRLLSVNRKNKMEQEIYSSCIVLKNLAIVQENSPLSTDRMLETLERNAKVLKPVYQGTLSRYRTGEADKAFEYFGLAIGTPNGKQFASLLSKMDYINPADLKEQAIAIEEAMAESRYTAKYKKAQTNGVITMALSTVAVMLVVMNFLMIVIFMDTLSQISGLM